MRFGVNYTPRVGWFHHWLDFHPDEVAADFAAIAALGCDHVRVFPLWPIFQPNASYVSAAALDRLDTLLRLAGEAGLGVCLDGLQGHLSSFDFLPAWLLSWHEANMFTDPDAIAATAAFLRALADVARAHPHVFALNVGNEVNQFTGTVHPQPHPATPQQISAWLAAMVDALRPAGADRLVTHACYDASWYDDTQPFTLEHVGRVGDVTTVHSWVFNGTAQRFGPDAFPTRAHARYMAEVARGFHADPRRPVWIQEIGAPRNVLPAASIEGFVRGSVEQLAGTPDLFGITWWCSHDVPAALSGYPALEYDLGLIAEDGTVKPQGRVLADAVARARDTAPVPFAGELAFDPGQGRAALAPGGAFWTTYMEHASRHGHPRVVVRQHAGLRTAGQERIDHA